MVLGVVALVGALLAWLLGADLRGLGRIRLRASGLVFLALGLQVVLFTRVSQLLHLPLSAQPVHVATYVLLLTFVAANLRQPGLPLAAVGFALNAITIAANHGRMPVSLANWVATGADPAALTRHGAYNNVVLDSSAHLRWLGDVFALPRIIPLANAVSVGDLLLLAGVTTFVYRAGVATERRDRAQLLEPLSYDAFRRLLAGRTVSKLGDWLTMTAVVTWVYARTGSSVLVSLFLVLRMSATVVGGIAAVPLLDRFARFRTLWFVEVVRGALMLATVPLAAAGSMLPVMATVALSAALSSASDPSASSIIPELLPERLVHAGNAAHGVARNLMMVGGTLAGGVTVATLGISRALLIDVSTFALAALLYRRFTSTTAPVREESSPVSRYAVLRVVLRHRIILGLVVSFAVVTAAMAILNASLPAFLDHRLGDIHAYGYGMAAIGAGLLCGEALSGCVRRESVARRSIALGFVISGAAVYMLSATTTAPTAYLLLFVLGASDGTTEVVYDTLFQSHLPADVLGAAFSVAAAIQRTGMIVGFVVAPMLLVAGWRTAFWVAAGACLAGAAVGAVTLIRPRGGVGVRYLDVEPAATAGPR